MTRTPSDWLHRYVILVLRLNRAIDNDSPFKEIEQYLPPEWYDTVMHEPVSTTEQLEKEVKRLSDALTDAGFSSDRRMYLSQQMTAIRTVVRRLLGETIPLQEEVKLCYDLETEIRTVVDRPARAMARYLGHHRARIYFNPKVPFPLADLFYVMCHEGCPGHLAEFVLKDDLLIEQRGYIDERVLPPASPRYVISEGVALLAPRMVFAPGEEMDWLAEHVFAAAGMKPPAGDLTLIHEARDILYGVSCNASMLLDEGEGQKNVLEYLVQFGIMDCAAAQNQLDSLRTIEGRASIFEYPYGKELLGSRLLGPEKKQLLLRALTEQVTPSQLASNGSPP